MEKIKLEVIAESVESALAAQKGGADRLELCVNLIQGGVTPNFGLIKTIKKVVSIPVFTMIRPRAGDFVYSDLEFEVMKNDIEVCKELNVDGVVLGILNQDGNIDIKRTRELVELAGDMEVTFHRAFDLSRDPVDCLEQVIDTGAARVLTSGWNQNVDLGLDTLRKLNKQSDSRIIILAGGGVNKGNIQGIIEQVGLKECHFSAKRPMENKRVFINEPHSSFKETNSPENECYEVDELKVKELRQIIDLINSDQSK